MLATTLLGLATTTDECGSESSATLLGSLLVRLPRHLEDLGQGLALVGTHGLLDVDHPRATLTTDEGGSGCGSGFDCFSCYGSFHFYSYARELLRTNPEGPVANRFH
jgi:hypothetical protein